MERREDVHQADLIHMAINYHRSYTSNNPIFPLKCLFIIVYYTVETDFHLFHIIVIVYRNIELTKCFDQLQMYTLWRQHRKV